MTGQESGDEGIGLRRVDRQASSESGGCARCLVKESPGLGLDLLNHLVGGRRLVVGAGAVETEGVLGDAQRTGRDIRMHAPRGADADDVKRWGMRLAFAGLEIDSIRRVEFDQRDLDIVGTDPGTDDGRGDTLVNAGERDVLAVGHLAFDRLEALRDPIGVCRIADEKDGSGDVVRGDAQVIETSVVGDDFGA